MAMAFPMVYAEEDNDFYKGIAPYPTSTHVDKTAPAFERGKNFERTNNPDGTSVLKLGVPIWTQDANGNFVPHIVNKLNSTRVQVQSGLISWDISKNEALIYGADFTDQRLKERWVVKVSDIIFDILDKFFVSQVVVENSTGVFVTNTYSATYLSNSVTAQITYAIYDGRASERIVVITGLPKITQSLVDIVRQWTSFDADMVIIDGTTQDAVDDKTETVTVASSYVEFRKDGELVIRERLGSAGNKFDALSYDKNTITFNYDGWTISDGQIKLIDDTTPLNNPTEDGHVTTNSATGAACPTGSFTRTSGGNPIRAFVGPSDSASFCRRMYFEWPLTAIPDGSDVTDVHFKFEVPAVTSAVNCDYNPMGSQPTVISDSALWTDIGDGTSYLANDATCTTAGTSAPIIPLALWWRHRYVVAASLNMVALNLSLGLLETFANTWYTANPMGLVYLIVYAPATSLHFLLCVFETFTIRMSKRWFL
jgi:hypothetical protein